MRTIGCRCVRWAVVSVATVATCLFGPVLFGSVAFAEESSAVEKALAQLSEALQQDESLAEGTRNALSVLVEALSEVFQEDRVVDQEVTTVSREEIAEAVDTYLEEKGADASPDKAWAELRERLQFYGDFRLRDEFNTNLDMGADDRHRQRVRMRVGANYKVTGNLTVGARVTTGMADDPNSPHHTFGTVFNSLAISLDRAYLDWKPDWFEHGWFKAGKFGHPFYSNPVYGELVWDGDVQPEGIAFGYQREDIGRIEKLGLVGGQYMVLEQGMADEGWATAVQASARVRLTDSLKSTFALGYYTYSDVSPDGSTMILADNAGNDATAGDFTSDFGILNPIVALTYDGWALPLTLSGEYVRNLRADIDDDEGWALGAALGKTKKKGDWKAYYQWQVIQQDAVFTPVAQDDFLLATSHRSHVFGGKYQVTDKVQVHLWSLASSRDRRTSGSDQTQWRLRADLNIKF